MSVVVKKPLIKIEVTQGKKRKLYLVPKATAEQVELFLAQSKKEDFILATELFPDLADSKKTPGIALKGVRLRLGLTQVEMAKKIGITQGDLSKMEKGERPLGKNMALKIGKALKIDYRRFL